MFIRKSTHNKIVEALKVQLKEERHSSAIKDDYIRELQNDLEKLISKYEKSKPM